MCLWREERVEAALNAAYDDGGGGGRGRPGGAKGEGGGGGVGDGGVEEGVRVADGEEEGDEAAVGGEGRGRYGSDVEVGWW